MPDQILVVEDEIIIAEDIQRKLVYVDKILFNP